MIFYKCSSGHRYGVNRESHACIYCGAAVSSIWAVPLKIPGVELDAEVVRDGTRDVSVIRIKFAEEILATMEVGTIESTIMYRKDKHGVVRLHVDKRPVDDAGLLNKAAQAYAMS